MHWTIYNNEEHKLRACGRNHNQEQPVAQVTFSTSGIVYSKVCGRITAYQFGATEAFTTDEMATLQDPYVDGVSITYGGNTEHVWTFAAARAQGDETSTAVCPCTNPSKHPNASIYIPSFVGSDYFCETGASSSSAEDSTLYYENLLWDGQSCYGSSRCCQFSRPPWFCKTLSNPTSQDVEVRIMNFASENQKLDGEDTLIETLYLYVQ
jgi:dynein heavy chain